MIDLLGKAKGITVKYDMVTTDNGEIVATGAAWLKGNNMRIDTIAEGKAMVMIVNGDDKVSYMYQPEEVKMKQCIWLKYGLPVQVEMTSPSGTSRAEMKNFDFSDIQDSTFELPEGVDIVNLSDMFDLSTLPDEA